MDEALGAHNGPDRGLGSQKDIRSGRSLAGAQCEDRKEEGAKDLGREDAEEGLVVVFEG